jgi:uncharacterized coiled-coil protein SlyX
MSIGLSKQNIIDRLKPVFLEELSPKIGLYSQEKIIEEIAQIITENNKLIEQQVESKLKELKDDLKRY